jgi:hypothetical protein
MGDPSNFNKHHAACQLVLPTKETYFLKQNPKPNLVRQILRLAATSVVDNMAFIVT